MSKQLQATRPEDYASLKSDDRPSKLVEMPSGAVFRLRRADIEGMTLVGELPQSLVSQGLEAWQSRGIAPKPEEQEAPDDVSPEETIERLIFMRQIVVENCLEPRIGFDEAGVVSLLDDQGKGIAKLQKADFLHAFMWITHQEGVAPEDGIGRFRNRRERRAAAAGNHGKKLRRAPVSVT